MAKKDLKTERRIDYTKHEIAERLVLSDNAIDYKLKQMCDYLGIKPELFKRYGEQGRNFFPADYGELLILLLKGYDENPATKKKTTEVTAEDVIKYNKTMREEIQKSEKLPEFQKECIMETSWFRESGDISEWTGLLVEELTQLLMNLLDSYGGDMGETIKFICRELDYMNYNLFRGSYIRESLQFSNNAQQHELEAALFEELSSKSDEERTQLFSKDPEFEYFYNAYKETKGNIFYINKNDISIDRGILEIMKAIMAGMGLKDIQETKMDKLPEYLNDKQYNELVELMRNNNVSDNDIIEKEREMYLASREEGFVAYVNMFLRKPGCHDMVISGTGREWESIPDRIEKGTFHEDYHEAYQREQQHNITEEEYMKVIMKLSEETQQDVFKKYLEYYNNNKEKNRGMHDTVSRFVGQVLLHYLSDSKE